MWVEILCCLVFYKLFRRFLGDDVDDFRDIDSSHSDMCFTVASRLEKLYGGKCFVGLRIPDPDSGTRQHIDIVLITKKEILVVAVRNFSGYVQVDKEGNWTCISDKKHKTETHPDPVLELSGQITTLQSYLEQRGASLPKGLIIGRVILPNPYCIVFPSIGQQTEVLTHDKWRDLKPDSGAGKFNWVKSAFSGGKGDNQDALHQNINFILSSSPMWDRLELNGNRSMLGEFIEFKGHQGDMAALKSIKRSKVSRIIVQKASLFGLGRSRTQIMYSLRDYRSDGSSSSEFKEIAVKPDTVIVFEPLNSKKPRKFKLSRVEALSLSS
ncbi:plasma protein [Carex rostrata]